MPKFLLIALLSFSGAVFASDADEIKECLNHWKDHPFKEKEPRFRTFSTSVRVVGIGKEITDTAKTGKPELVLIKPNISVMSKTTLRLLNPNGWYCLKGKVQVLGKSEVVLDCQAKLASSNSGAVIAGADNSDSGGVTVFGESRVTKVNCKTE